jgi:hypothetical protein
LNLEELFKGIQRISQHATSSCDTTLLSVNGLVLLGFFTPQSPIFDGKNTMVSGEDFPNKTDSASDWKPTASPRLEDLDTTPGRTRQVKSY